jgi:hypothetical protein
MILLILKELIFQGFDLLFPKTADVLETAPKHVLQGVAE